MSGYRKEWPCCGDETYTEAWEPERCPFCELNDAQDRIAELETELEAARAQQSGEGREAVYQLRSKIGGGWDDVTKNEYKCAHESYERRILHTHPLKAQGVPKGWKFERESGDRITIDADGLGFYVARMDAERIADIMLYALAQDLLPSEPDMGGEK